MNKLINVGARAHSCPLTIGVLLVSTIFSLKAAADPYDLNVLSDQDARAQLNAGEYTQAVQLATERAEALVREFSRFDPSLAEPLKIRAEALFRLEKYDAAIQTFKQARQIVRMSDGLHTTKQLEILYRLAEANNALGDPIAANDHEEAALALVNRAYPNNSNARVPAIMRLADWYLQAGYTTASRGLYEEAETITQLHLPQAAESYVQALEGVTATYVGQGFPNFDRVTDAYYSQFRPSSMPKQTPRYRMTPAIDIGQAVAFNDFRGGEVALKQLVSFRREQLAAALVTDTPERRQRELRIKLAHALLELGDWHIRLRASRKALAAFREAEALLGETLSLQEFGTPKLLFMPKLGAPDSELGVTQSVQKDGLAKNLVQGEVRFLLLLDNHGLVRRISKLSSTPADLIVFRYKQQTRKARYRPAMVDGQFVEGSEVEAVHRFTYINRNADNVSQFAVASE